MPTVTTVRVDGLRELGERMRKLSAKVANKVAGQATGAGARIVKKSAKEKLRSSPSIDSGLVEKNVIMKKLGKRQTNLTAEHIVTVKKVTYPDSNPGGKRNTRRSAGFLEFGTVNGTHMAAEPFLRPALDQNRQRIIDAMKNKLEAAITKAGA